MARIERKTYLDRLIAFRDKDLIKVISGVRRCGKSVLMEIFQDYLRDDGVAEDQIIAVNLEDYDFYEMRNSDTLYNYIKEKLVDNKKNYYVFLDEIQLCDEFPRVVDSLFIKKNVDVYVTGSNAFMLSSEIATMLSGRYVEIKMLPLSFSEYVSAVGQNGSLSEKYREYLERSSFPYVVEFGDNLNEIRTYLEGLYNTIIVKDVGTRMNITDTMMLESLLRFIFDNIGNRVSTKKIADTMTSAGRKIDTKTVEKYLAGLLDSFIIYQAKRYDVKGKQYLKTLEKYFAVDLGLRNYLLGMRNIDAGFTLENVIYLDLLRRGYDVYIGKVDQLEVDFVAKDRTRTIYIQVAATTREESTLQRELAPFEKINDNYPKILFTLDEDPEIDYDGIRKINALQWLVGNTEI